MLFPAFVIPNILSVLPLEHSPGTRPIKPANLSADLNRLKSPISLTKDKAV